jgi:hypothetical protein
MATKATMGGLRLQPTMATDAQRIARLRAMHWRLLQAAERLTVTMESARRGMYYADPVNVLALKTAVADSNKFFSKSMNERNS